MVWEALEVAGITALAHRVFNELSGGERQRVTIAMALAQQPTVLLLDEPTSHLDIKYQIETLALVQQLNRERGMTVIAAIHDLNLAARYFPRLLLFQRGIVADAGPAAVLEPGLLRRVYEVNVQVGILRGATHLSVLPPSSETDEHTRGGTTQPLVHVMAGGGAGEVLMRALADEHIAFVAGALNIGDSDHTLALRLADEVITEQPYAPISSEALKHVRASLQQVALLVICPMPIGPGNIALLREAVAAAQRGLPVMLFSSPERLSLCSNDGHRQQTSSSHVLLAELATLDYTGGEALKLFEMLLQQHLVVVHLLSEILTMAKEAQTSFPKV